MAEWRARDPVVRFRQWLDTDGWWDAAREQKLRRELRHEVMAALDEASKVPKAPITSAFEDVYESMPWHIQEQRDRTLEFARRTPHVVPPGVPVS